MLCISIQFAVFLQDEERDCAQQLFLKLQQTMSDTFTGSPMLLPIPKDAPADIPIGTLTSASGDVKVSISRMRLDLFALSSPGSGSVDWGEAVKCFQQVLSVIKNVDDAVPIRFGCTASFFTRTESPIADIKKRFFSYNFSESCNELSIQFNEPVMKGTSLNVVRTFRNALLGREEGESISGILETADINTNQHSDFRPEYIDDVLQMMGDEMRRDFDAE